MRGTNCMCLNPLQPRIFRCRTMDKQCWSRSNSQWAGDARFRARAILEVALSRRNHVINSKVMQLVHRWAVFTGSASAFCKLTKPAGLTTGAAGCQGELPLCARLTRALSRRVREEGNRTARACGRSVDCSELADITTGAEDATCGIAAQNNHQNSQTK